MSTRFLPLATAIVVSASAFAQTPAPVPAASKQTPPPGVAIPEGERKELTEGAAALAKEIAELRTKPAAAALLADVEIFHKAVHDALTYDEFFDLKQIATAKALLAEGMSRAKSLKAGQSPWTTATGTVVRGYRSRVDGSVQPYGLVIPAAWKAADKTPRPLYSWFHGRSENLTELAFISERMKKAGEFTPDGAFVLHLYGRFCNASKFAGETDFFEALAATRANYPVDPARLVAVGFSMGGATLWHLAAHHAGLFVAASPGAGFAETAIYNNVFSAGKEPPPWWEQKLWRFYDATTSAGNLFNTSLIAYSGEIDPQKQSADLMEKAAAAEGLKMERLIGPNTAHKYEPATKKELDRRLSELVVQGREAIPAKVKFTTYTLRYNKMAWLEVDGLEKHWERAQLDGELTDKSSFALKTQNITAFSIALPATPLDKPKAARVSIDTQEIAGLPPVGGAPWTVHFHKDAAGKWAVAKTADDGTLAKRHGLSGPIDEAFTESFIFIRPTGKPLNEKVGGWVKAELDRAIPQWRTVFRGEAPVKDDTALTPADIANSNLVLWGDPSSNAVLAKLLPKLPIQWTAEKLTVGKVSVASADHAPVMIFPNPLNPRKFIVINSSFTFREGSSQTNSQQTPKLPDWAVVDLKTPPNKKAPGAIVDAGFFNEHWQF